MKPFINIAIVLNVIYVFNSLPIIWVMTEGGPANGTDILVTYLYKLAFRFGAIGQGGGDLAVHVRRAARVHHPCYVRHGDARRGGRGDDLTPSAVVTAAGPRQLEALPCRSLRRVSSTGCCSRRWSW
jgi:hypothetical protein